VKKPGPNHPLSNVSERAIVSPEHIALLEQLIAEKADVGRFVQGALSRLKVEYREVILLREFEGLSYAEIASVTGDSASSVKSRLFKARRALAGKLEGVWNEERDDK